MVERVKATSSSQPQTLQNTFPMRESSQPKSSKCLLSWVVSTVTLRWSLPSPSCGQCYRTLRQTQLHGWAPPGMGSESKLPQRASFTAPTRTLLWHSCYLANVFQPRFLTSAQLCAFCDLWLPVRWQSEKLCDPQINKTRWRQSQNTGKYLSWELHLNFALVWRSKFASTTWPQ